MAVPYNYLNLPAIDAAKQRRDSNNFRMQEGQKAAQRNDQEWDDEQRMKNTRWMVGASKVGMDVFKSDPENFLPAMRELTAEAAKRGMLDPDAFDLEGQNPEEIYQGLEQFYNNAMIGVGGPQGLRRPGDPSMSKPMQNYAERDRLEAIYGEGSPQVQRFDEYVRASKVTDIAGVPTRVTPTGNEPLSTQEAELGFISASEQAKQQGGRAGQAVDLTPAELEIDKKFAAEYNDFMLGGFADAEKGLSQLEEVKAGLESGEFNLTGWRVAGTPDFVKVVTDPEALDARDKVEEVVQRNLRLILGAQFTENEGKRLIARAYNPALEEKFNVARVDRLIKSMASSLAAKRSAANYFQMNGTLKGWTGAGNLRVPRSQSEVRQEIDGMINEMNSVSGTLQAAKSAIKQGKDPVLVKQRLQQMGIDPSLLDE